MKARGAHRYPACPDRAAPCRPDAQPPGRSGRASFGACRCRGMAVPSFPPCSRTTLGRRRNRMHYSKSWKTFEDSSSTTSKPSSARTGAARTAQAGRRAPPAAALVCEPLRTPEGGDDRPARYDLRFHHDQRGQGVSALGLRSHIFSITTSSSKRAWSIASSTRITSKARCTRRTWRACSRRRASTSHWRMRRILRARMSSSSPRIAQRASCSQSKRRLSVHPRQGRRSHALTNRLGKIGRRTEEED